MPASYIAAAENELLALATSHIAKYDHPRVTYDLTPDWKYFKSHGVNLTVGDTATITDTDLGVNLKVRIIELTRQGIQPYKYTLVLSDQVEYLSTLLTSYKKADNAEKKIAASPVRDLWRSRRSWRDTEELKSMVFDPDDGYFEDGNIRPLSITTAMLEAGSKSGNFELNGVVIKPNYAGNNNKLSIGAGYLTHFNIDSSEADNIGTWTLVANTTYEAGGLTTGTAYYLYAKCKKDSYADGSNTVLVSDTAYQADQTTYWYFLIGILHSTAGSTPRGLSLTYGQTLINGGFITTGKIQSASGATYFDLDNNTLVIASGAGTIAGTTITSIENGATAGATWGTNIASVPARFTNDDATPLDTGIYMTEDYIGFWDLATATWPVRIKNNSGTGEFFVGNQSASKYISWDGTTMTVRGALNADDITAGTITGLTVQTDTGLTGHYERAVLSAASKSLIFYDSSNNNMIEMHASDGNYIKVGDIINNDANWAILGDHWLHLGSKNTNYVSPFQHYRWVTSEWILQSEIGYEGSAYFKGNLTIAGNITLSTASATVDGVDVSAHAGDTSTFHSHNSNAHTMTIDGRDVSADGSKLDGVETAADVTDAANVAAAGAIMDGDFSSNGFMKRTGAGTYDIRALGLTTAGLQFTDNDGGIHTVVINDGVIASWTVA